MEIRAITVSNIIQSFRFHQACIILLYVQASWREFLLKNSNLRYRCSGKQFQESVRLDLKTKKLLTYSPIFDLGCGILS